MMAQSGIGVVVIGRNEGERLKQCLRSIPAGIPTVYVDSGSTDNSVSFARSMGFAVIELDMSIPFTAARARNAGWGFLTETYADLDVIQFVDGDCEVSVGWFGAAITALSLEPNLAVVFGRRRERFPDKSIYNRLCDHEWNVPVGVVASCGGDALFRNSAIAAVGGYSDDLIAGEEPDLCLRLRRIGWQVRRIEDEMTVHDAAMYSFSSWWKRAKRSGFAYAEHFWRHGQMADPQWRRQVFSILVWAALVPAGFMIAALCASKASIVATAFIGLAGLSLYGLQIVRIAVRTQAKGASWPFAFSSGAFIVIGKFAELTGVLKCWSNHMLRRQHQLIEYKDVR